MAADVAKASGTPAEPAPETTLTGYINPSAGAYVNHSAPAAPASQTPRTAQTSLQKTFGIGPGGVIRDPKTKKVTLTGNTVTNPKPSKLGLTKTTQPPTLEEELQAEHPALAIPSIMTGMDMDTVKPKNGAASAEPPPSVDVPKPVQTGQPMPVTYESTLRELLMLAYNSGGVLHFGTGEFVLSIQLTAPALKSRGSS
jgi:hypothetical protein